jgi:hypothetical protein
MPDPTSGLVTILRRTLPWVRLLSTAGFLAVGFFALMGAVSWGGFAMTGMGQAPVQAVTIYVVLMLLAFVPAWHLRKYAKRIEDFVAQGHIVQLEAVLEAERAIWKFGGLLAILIGIVAIAAMVVGVLAAL